MTDQPRRIVIVGGGFAGVRAAMKLANRREFTVKLISQRSYFEYHAALYRSATGRSPLEVAIPLADFFGGARNVEVVIDRITRIDPKARVIQSEEFRYQYDSLILAVGGVTQYFHIDGLAEYSYGVKTIQEALELKRHLHEDLTGHQPHHYVVIGAGATGVELAAEMTAYLSHVRRRHGLRGAGFTVDLIEASERILPQLPARFSDPIAKRLKKLGVKIHLNMAVKGETLDALQLPHGEVKTHTVVWTAGQANNPLFAAHPEIFRLGRKGLVETDKHLKAHDDIYVVGDSAQTTYAGMAQTALHDANLVAENLIRQVKGQRSLAYHPERPIYAIPVGPRWSGVLWGRVRIYGYAGWVLRRLADLRLYLKFLTSGKAFTAWRYGMILEETCPLCRTRR